MRTINNYLYLMLVFFVLSCQIKSGEQIDSSEEQHVVFESPVADSIRQFESEEEQLLFVARELVQALKEKDFELISVYIHPDKGLRFSPYGYINVENDRVFKKEEVLNFVNDTAKYLWGNFDGSGDEMILTGNEYHQKFLYDVDFLKAPHVSIDSIMGHGNSLINIRKVYPVSRFVEYYFSGFDKKYNGMDWRSLRLIFQKIEDKVYLINVVHDQWTS